MPESKTLCNIFSSLSMVALFPCNDLVNLTADQQATFKVVFIEKLRQLVHTLTSQSLQILKLKKVGHVRKMVTRAFINEKMWLSSVRVRIQRRMARDDNCHGWTQPKCKARITVKFVVFLYLTSQSTCKYNAQN